MKAFSLVKCGDAFVFFFFFFLISSNAVEPLK